MRPQTTISAVKVEAMVLVILNESCRLQVRLPLHGIAYWIGQDFTHIDVLERISCSFTSLQQESALPPSINFNPILQEIGREMASTNYLTQQHTAKIWTEQSNQIMLFTVLHFSKENCATSASHNAIRNLALRAVFPKYGWKELNARLRRLKSSLLRKEVRLPSASSKTPADDAAEELQEQVDVPFEAIPAKRVEVRIKRLPESELLSWMAGVGQCNLTRSEDQSRASRSIPPPSSPDSRTETFQLLPDETPPSPAMSPISLPPEPSLDLTYAFSQLATTSTPQIPVPIPPRSVPEPNLSLSAVQTLSTSPLQATTPFLPPSLPLPNQQSGAQRYIQYPPLNASNYWVPFVPYAGLPLPVDMDLRRPELYMRYALLRGSGVGMRDALERALTMLLSENGGCYWSVCGQWQRAEGGKGEVRIEEGWGERLLWELEGVGS